MFVNPVKFRHLWIILSPKDFGAQRKTDHTEVDLHELCLTLVEFPHRVSGECFTLSAFWLKIKVFFLTLIQKIVPSAPSVKKSHPFTAFCIKKLLVSKKKKLLWNILERVAWLLRIKNAFYPLSDCPILFCFSKTP